MLSNIIFITLSQRDYSHLQTKAVECAQYLNHIWNHPANTIILIPGYYHFLQDAILCMQTKTHTKVIIYKIK